MLRVTSHFHLPAPPERAFGVLTDPDRLADWQPQVVEVRHDGPLRPGARLVEVRRGPLGKRLEQTVEVTALDAPAHFALRVLDGPARIDGEWRLRPALKGGTDVEFTAQGRVPRLLAPLVRRQMAAHHRRLASLVGG